MLKRRSDGTDEMSVQHQNSAVAAARGVAGYPNAARGTSSLDLSLTRAL